MARALSSSSPGFVKRHGSYARRDWERLKGFVETVEAVPGLRTARPLAWDSETGDIVYEQIPNHIALSTLTGAAAHPGTLATAARLLAAFHAVPVADDGVLSPRVQPLEAFDLGREDCVQLLSGMPNGFFWGDCWQGNVLLAGKDVYFIDPLPNRWLFDDDATVANAAVDVAMLYMSVFFCHPLHRLLRLDARLLVGAAEEMLATYLQAAAAPGMAPAIRRLARLIAVRYIDTARHRLPIAIASLRRHASRRLLHKIDDMLDWRPR